MFVQNVHHWREHKHASVLAIAQLRHQSASATAPSLAIYQAFSFSFLPLPSPVISSLIFLPLFSAPFSWHAALFSSVLSFLSPFLPSYPFPKFKIWNIWPSCRFCSESGVWLLTVSSCGLALVSLCFSFSLSECSWYECWMIIKPYMLRYWTEPTMLLRDVVMLVGGQFLGWIVLRPYLYKLCLYLASLSFYRHSAWCAYGSS